MQQHACSCHLLLQLIEDTYVFYIFLLIVIFFFKLFSRESMTSIDGYIATTQYDADFKILLNQESSYAAALKQLLKSIGDVQDDNCIDYIARKIVSKFNDDVFAFFSELKAFENSGYKFDICMINLLMESCIKKYNMDFYQFIQTRIVNRLSTTEIDQLNGEILEKFIKIRLKHVSAQRYLGLPRTIRNAKKNQHGI